MSDVTDAQREIAGIVAEFHRKIRMRTGMVDAISRIVVSDGLSLALGIQRDGAIFGNVELVPDHGVRVAAAEALEDATPAVEWRDYQSDSVATVGPIELTVWAHGTESEWRWCVDADMHTVRAGDPYAPESSRDAAKAAAIAAARAWRDSIRL